jgi:hypothetical protein
MNRILVLTVGLLVCSLSQISAQVNFQPGYVVSLRGDTLKGFIDYRNWEKSPGKIAFREKEGVDARQYGPLDVQAFSVADDLYASAIVKVEDSPTKISSMGYGTEFIIRTDTAFLRAMVSGSKSLYLYDERNGKAHFYIRQPNGFELLLYKQYLRGNILTESKTFIGQLKTYLGDCEGVKKLLPRTSYDKKSLEKVFAAYYACTGATVPLKSKTDRKPSEMGVIAGLTLSTLSLKANEKQIMMETSYPRSTDFTGGVFYNLPLLRNLGRLTLNNELIYTSYQTENHYVYRYESESWYQYVDTKFKYAHLKLNVMPRFKYPVGQTFLYVNAGLSFGATIQDENFRHYTNKFGSSLDEDEGKAFEKTEGFEFGYLAGGGLSYKRYSLEARYARTGGMVSTIGIGSSVSRLFFLVGYRIK